MDGTFKVFEAAFLAFAAGESIDVTAAERDMATAYAQRADHCPPRAPDEDFRSNKSLRKYLGDPVALSFGCKAVLAKAVSD